MIALSIAIVVSVVFVASCVTGIVLGRKTKFQERRKLIEENRKVWVETYNNPFRSAEERSAAARQIESLNHQLLQIAKEEDAEDLGFE